MRIATIRNTLRDFLMVIAAVAKISCKHGLWLVARVKRLLHSFLFGSYATAFPYTRTVQLKSANTAFTF